MKYYDDTMLQALNTLNITSICSKEELKNTYRHLCSIHHPDKGGKTEIMQNINWAYDYINEYFECISFCFENNTKSSLSEDSKKIFEQLILLDEIDVYVVGCWLWVDGNTKKHKEVLKTLGLYWHSKKSMWALAGSQTKSKGDVDFNQICDVYGASKHHKKDYIKI